MMLLRGFRYYFIKIIEDVQELSIVVLVNIYFPQQFDIFLTYMYRFNMSWYTFESVLNGALSQID